MGPDRKFLEPRKNGEEISFALHICMEELRNMMHAINPPGLSIPGISQAMLIENGRLLILSGHVPFDVDGAVAGMDLATQLNQVFENVYATLQAAGTDY